MTLKPSDDVIADLKDGLLTLTLNRPERRNALNAPLCEQLLDALRKAASESNVRAVLIRGAGGNFCVGGDIGAMVTGAHAEKVSSAVEAKALRDRMEVVQILHDMPKPTIAAIRGSVAGAGLSLALACDVRVLSRQSKVTTAFAKVGLSGDYGGIFFMVQLLGTARARELFLMSPVLTGEEAFKIGLATKVGDDHEVESIADVIGRTFASGPTVAYGYIKQNVNLAQTGDLEHYLDAEVARNAICRQTEDHREATCAFREKRPAKFVGN